jgi:hypothetical protein
VNRPYGGPGDRDWAYVPGGQALLLAGLAGLLFWLLLAVLVVALVFLLS